MNQIQAGTVEALTAGEDVLGCAKTGSGKTFAYLLPIIAAARRSSPVSRDSIFAHILAPTRELAGQIVVDAKNLCNALGKSYRAVLMISGTNIKSDTAALHEGPVTYLVCTPGRVVEHIQSTQGFLLQ